jgi:glutamate formiminotransferase
MNANMALLKAALPVIDIGRHAGVHPRLGILDVLPIIPVLKATMAEAVDLARELGRWIETELAIPVYLYEWAAIHPEYRNLADVRRLKRYNMHHPTAGAVCVGARDYLVAYNINLQTADIEIAKEIAAQLREANGGLPGVKAIGLYLKSTAAAQVSMNLVDPLVTTPAMVKAKVIALAAEYGVAIRNEEYIGLTPEIVLQRARAFEQELQ